MKMEISFGLKPMVEQTMMIASGSEKFPEMDISLPEKHFLMVTEGVISYW